MADQVEEKIEDLRLDGDGRATAAQLAALDIEDLLAEAILHGDAHMAGERRYSRASQEQIKTASRSFPRMHSRVQRRPAVGLAPRRPKMRPFVIDPARTAMIVVDMQNDFVAKGAPMETPAARAMVPMLRTSLDSCRQNGVRVIYTAHVHRPDGSDLGNFKELDSRIAGHKALVDGTEGVDIYPELAPMAGEHVIKKHRYSAFFNTDLDTILDEWGIDTVIICGTTTENCCLSTARDALFRNYRVAFLSDATATYDYPDLATGRCRMQMCTMQRW